MKKLFGFLVIALFSSAAHAEITCDGVSKLGQAFSLSIQEHSVTVLAKDNAGKVFSTKTFTSFDHIYDGHMTSLLTAPGLSVKLEYHYGCVRNVVMMAQTNLQAGTGNIETVEIPVCKDTSSPGPVQDLCN